MQAIALSSRSARRPGPGRDRRASSPSSSSGSSPSASSPPPPPPPRALILWDIENVRPPPGVSAAAAARLLKERFVRSCGFAERRTVCCLTPRSLREIEARSPLFVDDATPEMSIVLASHRRPKLSADYALKRELSLFLEEEQELAQAAATKARKKTGASGRSRVVLVTGDADFLEPVQHALRMGADVQLVHDGACASRTLLRVPPYVSPPVEWADLLLTPAAAAAAARLP
jgi:hypothetical protein